MDLRNPQRKLLISKNPNAFLEIALQIHTLSVLHAKYTSIRLISSLCTHLQAPDAIPAAVNHYFMCLEDSTNIYHSNVA